MAFISYTERPITALGSAWEAGTRLIWSKPFTLGPEYSPIRWTAFWNQAHQKHGHPSTHRTILICLHAEKARFARRTYSAMLPDSWLLTIPISQTLNPDLNLNPDPVKPLTPTSEAPFLIPFLSIRLLIEHKRCKVRNTHNVIFLGVMQARLPRSPCPILPNRGLALLFFSMYLFLIDFISTITFIVKFL